jgi:hypothetical protein
MEAQPNPGYKLAVPDPGVRLSAADRGKIRPGFDPEALERLLARLVPEVRDEILGAFQQPPPGESARNIVDLKEAELNALLDEVWLPMWEQISPRSLDTETRHFPGLRLARERRASRGTSG